MILESSLFSWSSDKLTRKGRVLGKSGAGVGRNCFSRVKVISFTPPQSNNNSNNNNNNSSINNNSSSIYNNSSNNNNNNNIR